jgi:hypothetical protein
MGGSITHTGGDRGFIYIIFGLGASHMGLWAYGLGFKESLPSPAHGLGTHGPFMRTTSWLHMARSGCIATRLAPFGQGLGMCRV